MKDTKTLKREVFETSQMKIKIDLLDSNPNQPRKNFEGLEELANSIKEKGLLEPITVRAIGDRYQIIMGERRWRAVKMAGFAEIEAQIKNVSDQDAYILALVENIQRQSFSPLEEAEAFKELQAQGWIQEKIGKLTGRSQQYITGRLSLLRLPEQVKKMITTRVVNTSTAQRLVSLEDEKEQIRLAKRSIKDGLNTRDIESAVKNIKRKQIQGMNKMDLFNELVKDVPAIEYYREAVNKDEIEIHNTGERISHSVQAVGERWTVEYGPGIMLYISEEQLQKNFTNQKFFWPKYSGAKNISITNYNGSWTEDLSITLFTEEEWQEWNEFFEKEELKSMEFPGCERFIFKADNIRFSLLNRRNYDPDYGRFITDNDDNCKTCPQSKIFIKQGWGKWQVVEFNDGQGKRMKRRYFKHDHIGSTLIQQAVDTIDPFAFSNANFRKLKLWNVQKVDMSWYYFRRATIPKEEMITALKTDLDCLENTKPLNEEEFEEQVLNWLQEYVGSMDDNEFREGVCTLPRLSNGDIDKEKRKAIFNIAEDKN